MFRTWRKRCAVRAYAKRLPALLRRDFGAAPHYTPQQIRRSIERYNLSAFHECYAFSMFACRTDFDAWHGAAGEACDYDAMRSEAAAMAGLVAPREDGSSMSHASCECLSTGASAANGHAEGPGLWSL